MSVARLIAAISIGLAVLCRGYPALAANEITNQKLEEQVKTSGKLTGTLRFIKERGVITLGYRETSIPFSYLDDSQKPVGFAMDICYRVVEAVKKELRIDKLDVRLTAVTASSRIPLLVNGSIDLECGSTTNTAERQKLVAFTNSHFLNRNGYVFKKSRSVKKIDDLRGQTVVSIAGTTNIKQIAEANAARKLDLTIITANDYGEALSMVETDRAVAFVMDDVLLAALVAGAKDPSIYSISKDSFSMPEPYGIVLRRDDPDFKRLVDAATAAIYTSGVGAELYEKWFMQKIPPKGLNLNLPISPALVAQFARPSDSADPASYVDQVLLGLPSRLPPTQPVDRPPVAPTDVSQSPSSPIAANTPGRKVALIIGNSAYKFMPSLPNPRNDAADIDLILKALGFETVMATDLDRNGMNGAIDRYSRMVTGASVAMVYYSGHGMQFMGKNYLLPTDAKLESAEDVNRYRLLPVDDLIELLGLSGGLQLIILDACRNNPIERDFKNKIGSVSGGNRDVASTRGFARIDARSGLIITYATAPNSVASDGNGRNSPFTQAFLKNVVTPDLEVKQMLSRVQREVYASSESKQLPEITSLYVGPEITLRSSR